MTEPFVPNMRAQMQSYYTILNDGVNYLKILFYKEKKMYIFIVKRVYAEPAKNEEYNHVIV
jgi:hypothetical protein